MTATHFFYEKGTIGLTLMAYSHFLVQVQEKTGYVKFYFSKIFSYTKYLLSI
jgi:hypothetical protein